MFEDECQMPEAKARGWQGKTQMACISLFLSGCCVRDLVILVL